MQDGRFGGPSDDDGARGFVGLDQFDGDVFDCGDGTAGQLGNFGHGDLASFHELVGSPGPAVFQHRPGRSTDASDVSRHR
jgi:hypothetical protein